MLSDMEIEHKLIEVKESAAYSIMMTSPSHDIKLTTTIGNGPVDRYGSRTMLVTRLFPLHGSGRCFSMEMCHRFSQSFLFCFSTRQTRHKHSSLRY
jgi:hypothetical protein